MGDLRQRVRLGGSVIGELGTSDRNPVQRRLSNKGSEMASGVAVPRARSHGSRTDGDHGSKWACARPLEAHGWTVLDCGHFCHILLAKANPSGWGADTPVREEQQCPSHRRAQRAGQWGVVVATRSWVWVLWSQRHEPPLISCSSSLQPHLGEKAAFCAPSLRLATHVGTTQTWSAFS